MAQHRVLIVDDNASNRIILTRCVRRAGYEAVDAESGQAALEMIADDRPDLALIDWMMPEMSGLELLAAIRASHRPEQLPVIMCTARKAPQDVQTALAAGANDFIIKPINVPVAIARIEAQLERVRATRTLEVMNRELEEAVADRTRALLSETPALAKAPDNSGALNEILSLTKWLAESRDADDAGLRKACAVSIESAARQLAAAAA